MLKVNISTNAPIKLDVDLLCKDGELLALVGPSGAGKSTVLRCIAGLQTPKKAVIKCQDQLWFDSDNNINKTPQQRRVGMVFQNYALFPHLTVNDNIRLAIEQQQTDQVQRISELLAQVNLTGLGKRYPAQLSGGQQQRVALARALARSPDVLLLDEPFSAVDKVTRRKLYLELNTLRRQLNMPIILVTHDLDEAAMLADTICVIHQGKTLQQGSSEQILYRPNNVTIARQVDVRNLLSADLVKTDGRQTLHWFDYKFNVENAAGFVDNQSVFWTISPSKVLLHQRVRKSKGERENPITATIKDMVTMRGITTVLLNVYNTGDTIIQMDLPEHVAMRNSLKRGETISVSLLADAIHLMLS